MQDIIYDYWAATLQDGYIGNLIELVERVGSARELYEMKTEHIKSKLNVTDRMVAHILSLREGIDIEKNYEQMIYNNINYVNNDSEAYPFRLRNIPSKPYGLFVKGALPSEQRKSVAIVGSRECTEYGRLMAEYLGDRLARRNIDIISGMAWGIDGISQMAAVKADGKSFAVLGCGVDVVYPRKNYKLYEQLLINGNGVISEYAPGTKAESRRFPPRNRIISGLCDVLIVVEARARSGTLITVEMAMDQGREIMVVPGRITDPLSVGCLNLMKEGAVPVTSIEDVLDELNQIDINKYSYAFEGKNNRVRSDKSAVAINKVNLKNYNLTQEEQLIYENIRIEPTSVEDISAKLNIGIEKSLQAITRLEFEGLIKEVGSFSFVKNVTFTN